MIKLVNFDDPEKLLDISDLFCNNNYNDDDYSITINNYCIVYESKISICYDYIINCWYQNGKHLLRFIDVDVLIAQKLNINNNYYNERHFDVININTGDILYKFIGWSEFDKESLKIFNILKMRKNINKINEILI
jgi:hypothetical protein